MSFFDSIQAAASKSIDFVYGDVATWIPSTGSGPEKTATVLFKDPTATAKLLDAEFNPYLCMMEYKKGDLPGLKEAADSAKAEKVTVKGIQYGVLEVTVKWDGSALLATLTTNV